MPADRSDGARRLRCSSETEEDVTQSGSREKKFGHLSQHSCSWRRAGLLVSAVSTLVLTYLAGRQSAQGRRFLHQGIQRPRILALKNQEEPLRGLESKLTTSDKAEVEAALNAVKTGKTIEHLGNIGEVATAVATKKLSQQSKKKLSKQGKARGMLDAYFELRPANVSDIMGGNASTGAVANGSYVNITVEGNRSVTVMLDRPNYDGDEGSWCVGVNLEGFKANLFGGLAEPPGHSQLQYFHGRGANCFRIGVPWERLQAQLGTKELKLVVGLNETVDYITQKLGSRVVLSPHGLEGLKLGGINAAILDFANLWSGLAKLWRNNDKVIFGLLGGPVLNGHADGVDGFFDPDSRDFEGKQVETWRQWAQAAIIAIREAGAKNLILVPGLHWSNCVEWMGGLFWGEHIDDKWQGGNTRLAALTDPAMRLAYDVRQHMDLRFSGKLPGCGGHDTRFWCENKEDCFGADTGLTMTIAWAKQYKKKLMMTELSSIPGTETTSASCEVKMHDFIKTMRRSGAFLGYQVSAAGCQDCLADLWTRRPLNLAWYGLGASQDKDKCGQRGQSCMQSRCCTNTADRCYKKDIGWAACKSDCIPNAVDFSEPQQFRTKWSCQELSRILATDNSSTAPAG